MLKRIPRIPKYATILGWLVCGLGAIFYTFEYLLRIEPSVMVPHLMGAFNVTAGALGMLTALYYYAYTPMQIVVGVLLDRYGARKIMTLAIIACTVGSYIFSTTHILEVAGVGRFLIGFGSAFAFVGVMKLAAEWLPKHHFALFAGFATSLGMAGAMAGDIGLTAAVHTIGWQKTLQIGTIIGVILIPFIWLVVSDTPKWRSEHLGRKTSYRQSFAGMWQIIKNPQMWLAGIIGCVLFLSLSLFAELWGIPFLQAVYLITPHQAAIACSMVFAGWLIGAPFNGWLSDRTKTRKMPLIIGSLCSAGIISLIIFKLVDFSFIELCVLLFLFGGFSSTQVICFVVSRENNPTHIAATAIASTNFLVMMSGVIYQPLFGKLLDLGWDGQIHNGIRVYTSSVFQHAFLLLPASLLVGAILALFLHETYEKKVDIDEFDVD